MIKPLRIGTGGIKGAGGLRNAVSAAAAGLAVGRLYALYLARRLAARCAVFRPEEEH